MHSKKKRMFFLSFLIKACFCFCIWLLLDPFVILCANQGESMPRKTILVVGGAGYIGSHVNKMLHEAGYNTVVLDNLTKGNRNAVVCGAFIEGDMADSQCLDLLFQNYPIEAVMHFAASIDVGESIEDPAKYYINNVSNTLNLLNAMLRHSVKKFIFSSSAAVYGLPQENKVSEAHPCHPINPYGQTKLIVEKILHDYDKAYGLKSCCLRYFNAAGGDPQGVIKNYKSKESNLIPVALRSLLQPNSTLTIFGSDYPTPDGTCIRDYIHICDLGSAHIIAMEQLLDGKPSSIYNLGNGAGFSVREVLQTVEKVTGRRLNVMEGPRREGDPPYLVADAQKALRELGWEPQYPSLEAMIEHAWNGLR